MLAKEKCSGKPCDGRGYACGHEARAQAGGTVFDVAQILHPQLAAAHHNCARLEKGKKDDVDKILSDMAGGK